MKLLEQVYKLRGRPEWTYRQVKREGDVCLVEQHRDTEVASNDGVMDSTTCREYEVFVVQKYPERERPDKKGMIPAKESPPPDYSWGRYGHSYVGNQLGKEMAEKKFQEALLMQLTKPNRSNKLKAAKEDKAKITE
jgi:hypothetical protein